MMTNDQRNTDARAPAPCDAQMPRRRFLTLAALGVVPLSWSVTSQAAMALQLQKLAAPGLLAMLGSERASYLGECYRQFVPTENDAQVLIQAILGPLQRTLSPNLAAALSEQVTQDFTKARTVTLGGWILAVTEARQCALYSLHAA